MLAPTPTAVYGVVLLMAAIAYYLLQCAIIAHQGRDSLLARALGRDWKGKLSPVIYLAAIPLAFVSTVDLERLVCVRRPLVADSRPPDRARAGEGANREGFPTVLS